MPPLKNLRQETFCLEAVKDNDYSRAYLAAGYQAKTPNARAVGVSQLIKNTNVSKRLEELRTRIATRVEVSRARVLNELGRIAFSDVRKIVGNDGAITDTKDWDDDVAGAVAGIETEKLFEGKGKDRVFVGYTQKVKLWDKNSALTNLAKHFQLLNEDPAKQGDTYNTIMNFYLPQNDRDVTPEHQPHALGNGHSNGHTD